MARPAVADGRGRVGLDKVDGQRRSTGPKVVAIGGGTGMPQLLRGLRQYTDNITAIAKHIAAEFKKSSGVPSL